MDRQVLNANCSDLALCNTGLYNMLPCGFERPHRGVHTAVCTRMFAALQEALLLQFSSKFSVHCQRQEPCECAAVALLALLHWQYSLLSSAGCLYTNPVGWTGLLPGRRVMQPQPS
jgi:hypothetical protein